MDEKELRSRIHTALTAYGVYEVTSYGWVDADTADPDLLGHAMWQTRAALWDDLDGRALKPIAEWQRIVSVAGADFEGLMIAARLSEGLAVLHHKELLRDQFADGSFGEVHLMAAALMLSSASDRLRQLFIATAFHKSDKEYGVGTFCGLKRQWYATPFAEFAAQAPFSSTRLNETMPTLPAMATKIQEYRDERNEVVHRIATSIGKREDWLLKNASKGKGDYSAYEQVSHEEIIKGAEAAEKQHRADVLAQLEKPIEWYKLLIEATNVIFIAEHELRDRL